MGVFCSEVDFFVNRLVMRTRCPVSGERKSMGPYNQEMSRGWIHESCEERGDWWKPFKINGSGKKSVTWFWELSATDVATRMKEKLFNDAKVFVFWS